MERGVITKGRGRHLLTGVIFPAPYNIAMSSLSYQFLYSLLNGIDWVSCDRFMTDRDKSIELRLSLGEIKIMFVTVPFVMNAPEVIKICRSNYPIPDVICIGGMAVAANPNIFSSCNALLFKGTIESHKEHINTILKMKRAGFSREDIFNAIKSEIDKVDMRFSDSRIVDYLPPHSVIYSNETEFPDMHLVEISRGCVGNCNFCMSKHLYGHYREFEYNKIIKAIDLAPPYIKRIGLIGDAVLAHSRIEDIVNYIIEREKRPSFASIRITDLTHKNLSLILKSEIKTLTIAPEVASQRLMKVTNKYYDKNLLFDVLRELVGRGVLNLKLYMMIGLPGEDKEDIEAMICFIKDIREILINSSRKKGKVGMLKVSINNFVPSPFTPLYSQKPDDINSLRSKQLMIKEKLDGLSNISISMMDILETLYQTALFKCDSESVNKILYLGDEPIKKLFKTNDLFAKEILRLCYG